MDRKPDIREYKKKKSNNRREIGVPKSQKTSSSTLARLRAVLMVLAVGGVSMLIWFLRTREVNFIAVFGRPDLNHEMSYQLITLGLFGIFVLLSLLLSGTGALAYLRPNRLKGEITPVPWLGIRPKEGENWLHLGTNFLVIITIVTSAVIYFQLVVTQDLRFSLAGVLLPAIAFAVVNSLVEEGIYRHSVVSVFLQNGLSARSAAVTSAVLFGAVHYFGNPGGVPGVFLAAFIGWFLAKSIAETRSFAWAWLIHFVQDVIIFSALFDAV